MRVHSVMPHPYVQPAGEGKVCGGCKQFFPFDEFGWCPNKSTGKIYRSSRCKSCKASACRDWNKQHGKTKLLNGNLVKRFGITLENFTAMLVQQGGVCAICGQPPLNTNRRNWRLNVDHCHKTGAVRALLCSNCNNGLGCFHDDAALLRKAISYLESLNQSS